MRVKKKFFYSFNLPGILQLPVLFCVLIPLHDPPLRLGFPVVDPGHLLAALGVLVLVHGIHVVVEVLRDVLAVLDGGLDHALKSVVTEHALVAVLETPGSAPESVVNQLALVLAPRPDLGLKSVHAGKNPLVKNGSSLDSLWTHGNLTSGMAKVSK